ncbi:hypothetical protein DUNSADRAFT_3191, partial [Dunaliella salina]
GGAAGRHDETGGILAAMVHKIPQVSLGSLPSVGVVVDGLAERLQASGAFRGLLDSYHQQKLHISHSRRHEEQASTVVQWPQQGLQQQKQQQHQQQPQGVGYDSIEFSNQEEQQQQQQQQSAGCGGMGFSNQQQQQQQQQSQVAGGMGFSNQQQHLQQAPSLELQQQRDKNLDRQQHQQHHQHQQHEHRRTAQPLNKLGGVSLETDTCSHRSLPPEDTFPLELTMAHSSREPNTAATKRGVSRGVGRRADGVHELQQAGGAHELQLGDGAQESQQVDGAHGSQQSHGACGLQQSIGACGSQPWTSQQVDGACKQQQPAAAAAPTSKGCSVAAVPVPAAKVCVPPVVHESRTTASEAVLLQHQASSLLGRAQRAHAQRAQQTQQAQRAHTKDQGVMAREELERGEVGFGEDPEVESQLDSEEVECVTGAPEVPERLQVGPITKRCNAALRRAAQWLLQERLQCAACAGAEI